MSEYECDWPQCEYKGEWAHSFVDTDDIHRPVCRAHALEARSVGAIVRPISEVQDVKVPKKPQTQAEQERQWQSFREQPEVRRFFGEDPSRPSRPPLREAFANLAGALLDKAKEEVERWRKQ